jgi:outer membrane protein OmpA-like peptidoglycan-associated protein
MKSIIYFLTVSVFFASCCAGSKMEETAKRISEIKKGQAAEEMRVNSISSVSFRKLAEIKLDSIINQRMAARVIKSKKGLDSVNAIIASLEEKLKTKKEFRSSYRTVIIPGLAELDNFRKEYDLRQNVYVMLEDGLDITNYTLFDLAAFFGPGKYQIPEEAHELAVKSFAPMVDSVIKFSNKYKELPRKATLVILGFADGTGFAPESELYRMLAEKIGKPQATNPELNQKLSELRATELVKMLTRQFVIRDNNLQNREIFTVEYLQQGKGEQYPLPTITDYRADDERRRIVLCYWAVIPD